MQDHRLPVTVPPGCLGAGGATLLNRFVNHHKGRLGAVIVNDISAFYIDAEPVRSNTELSGTDELRRLAAGPSSGWRQVGGAA